MTLKICSNDPLSRETFCSFQLQGEAIPVRIVRGTPRRKRMAVRVTRTGTVELLVPVRASDADISRVLRSGADWLTEHLRRVRRLPPVLPKRYLNGEDHFFRGRPFTLEVVPVPEKKAASVELERETGLLKVEMKDPSPERVRCVLQRWYRKEVHRFIEEHLALLCPKISWLEGIPSWKVRIMRRRWGSCSRTGELTLNVRLIHVSEACLDFVLLHEMAHLREMNHGRRFYAVLESLLPDWKERKRELDRMGWILVQEDSIDKNK